jgi:RNA polymerase sigma factor (sigma-70 family)
MSARELPLSELHEQRQRFLELVRELRPDLHRYAARMTGSIADGEDVVQDTLARAYYVLGEMEELPQLRPWLFRIANRRALDHLRRYDRRMGVPLEEESTVDDDALDPEDALAQEESVQAAVSRFVALPPAQRSCVILKDVLGHSLEEIASLLDLSVPAVKAALHRGRARLREGPTEARPPTPIAPSPTLARYAALFNARDWDAVRAMLADDVRLDLVSRAQREGPEVSAYFTNYAAVFDWHLAPAWLEGREVLAVFRGAEDQRPSYFVELQLRGDRIALIRDYRYVPYIAEDASFERSR